MSAKLSRVKVIATFGLIFSLATLGCSVLAERQWNELWGSPSVIERQLENSSGTPVTPEFYADIKPIMDNRCVVCHACYDAPCQLQLSSFEGLDRGASQTRVYDGTRWLAQQPSRLFRDAKSTQEWRQRGYYPVLNERKQDPEINLLGSSLYRMLQLKQAHPLPDSEILPATFDFSSKRVQQCAPIEAFDRFEEDYPLWGMPYGLPGLDKQEISTVQDWVAAGAPAASRAPLATKYQAQVAHWEGFFNQSGNKAQLVARYLYEHLHLGNLYFSALDDENAAQRQFFKLVRSRTPPGKALDEIASRRPFDSPGDAEFYYRLRPLVTTIVDKTHMPYRLDPARMERWQALFFTPEYSVPKLPGYAPAEAANPFLTFKDLPAKSRFSFMLDEAQYTIMGYIKGPVCRGQMALNAIEDQFWVFFLDPDQEQMLYESTVRKDNIEHLVLPAADQSNALPTAIWTNYASNQRKHLKDKLNYIRTQYPKGTEVTLDVIWDGDGHNPNAALTIFRHFDSATVVKGLQGAKPETAWVITYSLLERIHYLLVAGFDVHGNLGHQLNTRLYMDFLRMEGESNFLLLMPLQSAEQEFLSWYRGAEDEVTEYLKVLRESGLRRNLLNYQSDDHKSELYDKLITALGPNVSQRPRAAHHLSALEPSQGAHLSWLPETILVQVIAPSGNSHLYTLLVNRAHSNVSSLFWESARLVPKDHTVTVMPGVIGSYPNSFLRVDEKALPDFMSAIGGLSSEADYRKFKNRYGVRRNADNFWAYADWLHSAHRLNNPIEAGILDFSRLENR